jgi:hypothetical protein
MPCGAVRPIKPGYREASSETVSHGWEAGLPANFDCFTPNSGRGNAAALSHPEGFHVG